MAIIIRINSPVNFLMENSLEVKARVDMVAMAVMVAMAAIKEQTTHTADTEGTVDIKPMVISQVQI